MYRYRFLDYVGRDPEEAARRLPGPGAAAETVSVSLSARVGREPPTLARSFRLTSPRH